MVKVHKYDVVDRDWPPEVGDIRVTQHMDSRGMLNAGGRHTNYGYSGSVLVYVWDGEHWAWLRRNDRPDLPTGFACQYEAPKLIDQYVNYFEETLKPDTTFRFWQWKGKRYAAINDSLEERVSMTR